MNLLQSLSLRNRFLIAPILGVVVTLVLYFTSNEIIQSHSDVFEQLNRSNLPQVSEISKTSILLTNNHARLSSLLISAENDPDEELIYLGGRKILNELHDLEEQLKRTLASGDRVIIDTVDIFKEIELAFRDYRDETISSIELSTVNPELAQMEMHNANVVMQKLNAILLTLTEYYITKLSGKSELLQDTLYDKNIVTIVSIILLLIMISFALFFSGRMTADLEQVYRALVDVSEGRENISLPHKTAGYMQRISSAVHKFRNTVKKNEIQQIRLNRTIEELTDSKERYFNLLNITATAIVAIDQNQKIVLFNKAAERMFGYDSALVLGKHVNFLIPEKFRKQHEGYIKRFEYSDQHFIASMNREPVTALRENGEQFYIEASIAKLKLANETLMTVAISDVSDRLMAEEKILYQAHYDSLTGLPNRFLSLDRLSQQIKEAQRNVNKVAVLFVDLDDFKKVNDSLGHETGDDLLKEAARRLRDVVRKGDTVGRLGGDEFIVMLPGLEDITAVRTIVSNIINQLRTSFKIDGRELVLSASIGIAMFPDDGETASELLRKADSAMYHAKETGRDTYSFFTEEMNQDVSRRLVVEEQMHGALERGEFYLVFQPQVDVEKKTIFGAEALLRWRNPVLGELYPDEFIPIAEQNGLIVPIGQFVLTEALKAISRCELTLGSPFRIAVNLSPRQFRDPNLVNFIRKAVHVQGIASECLELEITEGVLMSGHAFIDDALIALSKMGVGLSLDDFGTGYSSLSYLQRYSFDALKIDRSFVNDINVDKSDLELVNAIIVMAHSLGLKVIAEGVENEKQLDLLAIQHCEFAQGQYFSKAVSEDEIVSMLVAQKSARQWQQVMHTHSVSHQ